MSSPHGPLVAAILARSWRPAPPPLELSQDELDRILPDLQTGRLAGLVWQRCRRSPLAGTPAAVDLLNAYRRQALQQRVDEIATKEVITDLRSAGIEPIILKGWAIARLYPERALRPYGDLDLAVRPGDLPAARRLVAGREVDLDHAELGATLEELFARSQLVPLDDVEVRVLSPEDQLRLLCLHFFRHGGWRPLWLIDIAVALEVRPVDFDWDWCLRPDRRLAQQVMCAAGLAHQLLHANLEGTPIAASAGRLPRWLVPAVLQQWEKPDAGQHPPFSQGEPIATYLRRPAGLLPALCRRWPDPISATANVRGPFNNLPRVPFQLQYALLRLARLRLTDRS